MIGNNLIGKKVLARGKDSGVYFGVLASRDGQEVEMHNVRNIWYWSGAAALPQLAAEGVKNPADCKFTMTIDSLVLLDVVEIVPCTDEAIANIEAVRVWKR